MKATIDGITSEGTPEEISAMMLIQAAQKRTKPFKHSLPYSELIKETDEQLIERLKEQMRYGTGFTPDWMMYQPKITCTNNT